MGNQVNPVGAYLLSDFTVGRLLQECGGDVPSCIVFMLALGDNLIITVGTE